MDKNTGKIISKNLRSKYNQKLLDHAKQCTTDAPKTTSKKAFQKTAESTGYLIGNKNEDVLAKSYVELPQVKLLKDVKF